jgi:hypothetical protein
MWKSLTKVLLYYGLPILLILSFPLYVYWQAREFAPIKEIIQTQDASSTTLFGFGYDYASQAYKESLLKDRNADIAIIGTSRVLEFHQLFFASSTKVVNAGLALPDIFNLNNLLNDHPANSQPKIILLGIDPWMFKPGSEVVNRDQQVTLGQKLGSFIDGNWRTVYSDYFFYHKFGLNQLAEARTISSSFGINALVNDEGFMADGSQLYGTQPTLENYVTTVAPQAINQMVASIQADRSSFDFGTSTSAASLVALNRFLATAKARNIRVIGFITPYPHPVYQELMSVSDQYKQEAVLLPAELSLFFTHYNFPLFNYMDAASVGIPDNEFLDFQHTSDKGSLRMLIDMAEKDSALGGYVSVPKLKSLLANTPNSFINPDVVLSSLARPFNQ